MGDFIRYYDDVDVSVAVQTPNGLMVPIVKHADELGLLEISGQVKSLAKKVQPSFAASPSPITYPNRLRQHTGSILVTTMSASNGSSPSNLRKS